MKAAQMVSTTLTYRSHAKINLYLKVLDRREDGYHNIETIFQTVDLCDGLSYIPQPSEVTLECNLPDLSLGDDNLIRRAAMLLKQRCACDSGVHIKLDKHIPVAAGLAGGSGDAAATLTALNELWHLDLSHAKLQELALELGSDVPYCLVGGTTAGTGRGDRLTPLEPLRETWFLLVHPPFQVSTQRAFHHPRLIHSEEQPIDGMTPSLGMAIGALNKGAIADMIFNAMEEVVFSQHPELAVLKQRLLDAGCSGALMSGSGPTLFGICRDQEHAGQIAAQLHDVRTSAVKSVPNAIEKTA